MPSAEPYVDQGDELVGHGGPPDQPRPTFLGVELGQLDAGARAAATSALVVALALIPEVISFSIIAGVDPRVGLFASFTMAVSIAFLGGRSAMISAATGAVALG